MIHVEIFESNTGEIKGFLVRGHACYAPEGQDIICAGVSALVQAAIQGLRRFLTEPPQVEAGSGETARLLKAGKKRESRERQDRAGKAGRAGKNHFLKVMLPDPLREKDREAAKIILETLAMGLEGIVLGYGKYVEIRRCRKC